MNQVNHKTHIIELYWLLLIDLVAIVISYVLAVLLRFHSLRSLQASSLHFTICLCLMLISTIYSLLLDWNKAFLKRGYFVEAVVILKYNGVMLLVVMSILFVAKLAEPTSRLVVGYFFVFNIIVTWVAHAGFKNVLRKYLNSERNKTRLLVLTESHIAKQTVKDLIENMEVSYEIIGIALLDDKEIEGEIEGIPVIANCDNVMEVAKQLPLDEVFIRLNNISNAEVITYIKDFESMGLICHFSIDIGEWNAKESRVAKVGKFTVISYSIYNIDYRRLMIKRATDIAGGLIGLLITAVLTPFIALAIKIESKGPVVFSQVRIGKNGRRFNIYKFRSMYIDAEERKKELVSQNEISGLMFKMKDDPRITKVGKFIRKTSLDELPQFYNILKGDMSLVGTRPPTVDEFEKYSLYYRRRLCMTPGLTGLWQVSGRSDIEDFDDVVKLDLEYIDNWSLTLDFKILLQTIWVVLAKKGSK